MVSQLCSEHMLLLGTYSTRMSDKLLVVMSAGTVTVVKPLFGWDICPVLPTGFVLLVATLMAHENE